LVLQTIQGKVMGLRVLDVEGPSSESSLTASGSIKGAQVMETLTFVARPTNTRGIIHGNGIGVIMTG
jgi:nitrous oxide reductase accessory protein NosL